MSTIPPLPPPRDVLLTTALECAVPLWVARLQLQPLDRLLARAPELANIIAEKGDVIQFRSKKRGETANAFNALAEAIAILSFSPGGVKFAGSHWENRHQDSSGTRETSA